ncbi:uncharacterized protein [Henckelia pumila]|uniref:uncharacterized protein n=1 Tax=Henckelia pumila TaxID=405737 RepID=UPI003C6E5E54
MEINNQIVHTGPILSFGPEDLKGVSSNHNDALEAINQMDLGQYKMEPFVTSLFGFTGHAIRPVGLVYLPLSLGKSNGRKTRIVSFIIVDAPSAYNAILGRPAKTTFMAVASALHQKMKFPVGNEVGEVQGDQVISRKCYVEEVRIEQKVTRTDSVDRPRLSGMEKVNLIEDTSVSAEEEIEEIMISPPSGMDLSKACTKDCYPLPRIDQLVDSTAGHVLLSFLDAYQGYHQIPLAKEDKDKVSFVTSTGTYCYVVMPFGLKNAGATYQRLMDKVFKQQIGKNIEVYVDDILVKTRTAGQFITDLTQTFQTLKYYQLKLNPNKCTFGVRAGNFWDTWLQEGKSKLIQKRFKPSSL